ncbi:hypothetical protein ACQ4PT_062730 [Festuca glaucescens]
MEAAVAALEAAAEKTAGAASAAKEAAVAASAAVTEAAGAATAAKEAAVAALATAEQAAAASSAAKEAAVAAEAAAKDSAAAAAATARELAAAMRYSKKHILQLVIKDAPSLERLLPLYPEWGRVMIQVIRAPKLEVLGLLFEGLSKVQFGTTIFEKMIAISLTTKIHTMKVLVLDSIGPNLNAVVDFLKCFPCLVRLYVISHPTKDMNNARMYDPLDPIECLELHLKKVVLMNYNGSKRPSVEFAKFFVLNSKLLKEMEIEVLNNRNDKWMANQRKQLCVNNRASRDARIELKIGTKKSDLPKMDTHDLSMADPFESRAFR